MKVEDMVLFFEVSAAKGESGNKKTYASNTTEVCMER